MLDMIAFHYLHVWNSQKKKIKKELIRARIWLNGSMLAIMPETLCLVPGNMEKNEQIDE